MVCIAGTNGCVAQRRKPRKDGWTKTKRVIFLDQLEASCNIRQSAAAAGMTDGTARALRRRDPEFAAAWAEALEIGCERLRAELLALALQRGGDGETPTAAEREGVEPVAMDDSTRIRVLQICRSSAEGRNGRSRQQPLDLNSDDVFAAIAHKLDRLEAKIETDGEA